MCVWQWKRKFLNHQTNQQHYPSINGIFDIITLLYFRNLSNKNKTYDVYCCLFRFFLQKYHSLKRSTELRNSSKNLLMRQTKKRSAILFFHSTFLFSFNFESQPKGKTKNKTKFLFVCFASAFSLSFPLYCNDLLNTHTGFSRLFVCCCCCLNSESIHPSLCKKKRKWKEKKHWINFITPGAIIK